MKPFAPTSAHFVRSSLGTSLVRVTGITCAVVCALFAGRPHLHAQGQAALASLSGTIQDRSGAVIPGATVTLSNPEKGFSREFTSDASGRYTFSLVPAGDLQLESGSHGIPDLRAEWNSADRRSDRNSGCNPHGRPSHPNGGGSRYGSGLKHRQCQCGYGHLRAASC